MTTNAVKPAAPRGLESNALEAVRPLGLEPESKALLRPELTLREYVEALVEAELFPDAVKVLGLALPLRETIWWACLCVRSSTKEEERAGAGAFDAAERWVRDPSDANRREAGKAAEAEEFETASALAALAAFFSGGSLAPADSRMEVPPPEGGATQIASGAVTLAAVLGDPERIEDNYRAFVNLGFEVARGRQGWGRAQAAVPAPAR